MSPVAESVPWPVRSDEPRPAQQRQAAHAPWFKSARAALERPRLTGTLPTERLHGLFSAERYAHDAAEWSELQVKGSASRARRLPSITGESPERLVERIAEFLLAVGNVRVTTVADRLIHDLCQQQLLAPGSRVTLDRDALGSFIAAHGDAIRSSMQVRLTAERARDVERTLADLAAHPELSAHEVWLQGAGALRRRESTYFESLLQNELAPHLHRPIDRMGAEPNYLVASHFARFLLGCEEGTTFASAVDEFKELAWESGLAPLGWKDFSVADAERLIAIYPFIPRWRTGTKASFDLGLGDLPEDLHNLLTKLSQVPFSTKLMRAYAEVRGERGGLAGSLLVTTEHALADKIDLFRHLIAEDGMAGKDIRVVWKHHSADALVIELCQRLFGITGEIASPAGSWSADARLEWLASGAMEKAVRDASVDGRTVNIHLQGVRSWAVAGELRGLYPNVPINACAHTTSEVPEISSMPPGLESVALSLMATADAKIRFERHVFTLSFTRLFLQIEKALESEIDVLRSGRRFLVYGGAGRIIGGAVVDALRSMGLSVAVVDPWLATPEGREKRDALIAQGADVITGESELEHELRTKKLFIVNATAEDAFRHGDYTRLGKDKTVVLNLGTGQRGFSMEHLTELAFDKQSGRARRRRLVGEIDRHQASYAYEILNDKGSRVRVFALGDGAVYNLGERAPNPREMSAFNNVLILESLHQAAYARGSGQLGPRVLGSVRVAFTGEDERTPVVAFLPRDTPEDLPWPKVWPRPIADSGDAVMCVDLGKSPDEVRAISASCAT